MRYRNALIIGVLYLFFLFIQFHRIFPSPLFSSSTIMTDLAMTAGTAGLLFSIYFLSYAFIQPVSGIMADRFGGRFVLLLSGGFFVGGSFLFAFSENLGLALFARILIGLGAGAMFISMVQTISSIFSTRAFPYAFGFLEVVGRVGFFTAVFFIPIILETLKWQTITLYVSILILVLIIAYMVLIKIEGPEVKEREEEDKRNQDEGRDDISLSPDTEEREKIKILDAFRIKGFFPLFLAFLFNYAVAIGIVSWLPKMSLDIFSVEASDVGIFTSFYPLGGMVGFALLGFFADRVFSKRKPILIMSYLATSLAVMTLVLSITMGKFYPPIFASAIFSIGLFSALSAIAIVMGKELVSPRVVGTIIGTLNIAPILGGSIIPWIMGVILDYVDKVTVSSWNYSQGAYLAAFVFCFIALIIGFISSLKVIEGPEKTY